MMEEMQFTNNAVYVLKWTSSQNMIVEVKEMLNYTLLTDIDSMTGAETIHNPNANISSRTRNELRLNSVTRYLFGYCKLLHPVKFSLTFFDLVA